MKHFIVAVLLSMLVFQAHAQWIDPNDYSRDIEANIGIQGAPNTGCGADLRTEISYGQFYKNGLGFRAGLAYMPENLDIKHSAGIPISFAWRLLTQGGEPTGFKDSLDDKPYYESYYDDYQYNHNRYENYGNYAMERFAENAMSFFLSLISRLEVNAGLTPGYIFGADNLHYSGVSNQTYGMVVRNPFYLTADIGLKTSWRVWRFNINMNPALHYSLTDNIRTKNYNGTLSKPHRTQLSLVFGLNFIF